MFWLNLPPVGCRWGIFCLWFHISVQKLQTLKHCWCWTFQLRMLCVEIWYHFKILFPLCLRAICKLRFPHCSHQVLLSHTFHPSWVACIFPKMPVLSLNVLPIPLLITLSHGVIIASPLVFFAPRFWALWRWMLRLAYQCSPSTSYYSWNTFNKYWLNEAENQTSKS